MPNVSKSPSTPSSNATTPALDPHASYMAALDARRPVLAEMPESRISRRSRLDPNAVHQIAMGAAVKLIAYRAALVGQFGAVAAELVDGLPTSAIAAKQADIELQMATEARDLGPQQRELSDAYAVLMTDANSLASRGHLPKELLDRARDTRGYEALVDSTLKLVALLRAHWVGIQSKTPITQAEIVHAERAALTLNQAISARNQGALRAPAVELRIRALSQVIYEYDQLRRMMTFLRWTEDDVDEIVPSLYAGRGRRSDLSQDETTMPGNTPKVDAEDDSMDGPSPAEPSPNNGGPPFVS